MWELITVYEWVLSLALVVACWHIVARVHYLMKLKYLLSKQALTTGAYMSLGILVELYSPFCVALLWGGAKNLDLDFDRYVLLGIVGAGFFVVIPISLDYLFQWINRKGVLPSSKPHSNMQTRRKP